MTHITPHFPLLAEPDNLNTTEHLGNHGSVQHDEMTSMKWIGIVFNRREFGIS